MKKQLVFLELVLAAVRGCAISRSLIFHHACLTLIKKCIWPTRAGYLDKVFSRKRCSRLLVLGVFGGKRFPSWQFLPTSTLVPFAFLSSFQYSYDPTALA